jgi:hypothetical protein
MKKRASNVKLRLAKETVRMLISQDLQQIGGGGHCPSLNNCSSATSESLNECGSLFCSMQQY